MQSSTVRTARGRKPLKASQAVRATIKARGKQPGNIVFIYGPKVCREWVLRSNLELAAMLWAESSQEVLSYSCDIDTIWAQLSLEGYAGSKPDIGFQRYKGPRGLYEVKYEKDLENDPRAKKQAQIQSQRASELGYTWNWYTEKDAIRQSVQLMNWLSINSALEQFRHLGTANLQEEIANLVRVSEGLHLADIYREFQVLPREEVFVATMRAHQKRQLTIELAKRPFALSASVKPWELQ